MQMSGSNLFITLVMRLINDVLTNINNVGAKIRRLNHLAWRVFKTYASYYVL